MKSTKNREGHYLKQILEKLETILENRSLRVRIMLASTGIDLRICNVKFVEKILKDIIDNVDSLKKIIMPELVSLSRIIGTMDFTTDLKIEEIVARKILQEAGNRIEQSTTFNGHKNHIQILHNLILRNIYDFELLENVFRPDYIRFIYKKNKILEPEMYKLDAYCRLNLALEYKGELLSDIYIAKMGLFLTNYFPREETSIRRKERFIMQVHDVVKTKYKFFKYANAAAHFKHAGI